MLGRFSHVQLFATLWTIVHQSPLSMGCSRQESWSGLPCPPPGDLPNPGIKPTSLISPALAGGFFTTSATWEAPFKEVMRVKSGHTGEALVQYKTCLYKRKRRRSLGHAKKRTSQGTYKRKLSTSQKSREAQGDSKNASTLILDLQPPELAENKLLFLSHPVCGILLTAALAN